MIDAALAERFWKSVERREGDGCWLWRGHIGRSGYGQFRLSQQREIGAHRFAYELANGPIPPGLFICHRCDTPLCVRPDHLFAGTQSDNILDAVRKGRAPIGDRHYMRARPEAPLRVRGELNGNRRLDEAAVRAIRAGRAAGRWYWQLAAEFGVSKSCAFAIVHRKTWAWLDER